MPPLVHETPKVSDPLPSTAPIKWCLAGGGGSAMVVKYASHVPEKTELAAFRAACFLGVDSVKFRRVGEHSV